MVWEQGHILANKLKAVENKDRDCDRIKVILDLYDVMSLSPYKAEIFV